MYAISKLSSVKTHRNIQVCYYLSIVLKLKRILMRNCSKAQTRQEKVAEKWFVRHHMSVQEQAVARKRRGKVLELSSFSKNI